MPESLGIAMALKSLNQLRSFRNALIRRRNAWLERRFGLVLGEDVSISLSARFRSSRRGDISVGDRTLIAFKTLFLTKDARTGEIRPIRIGSHCFIGGGSTVLPGVTIGDECIVGGGSVVFEDVPPRSIVVGNPARVLRRDIEVGPFGRLAVAAENTRRMYRP
jgi:maltose O-acetyltransferase